MDSLPTFGALSDHALLLETRRLASNEREATAALIAALTEVDSRGLYLSQGHSSLFNYCIKELGLSEPSTYKRIEVARVSRVFPEVLDALKRGALNVSTAVLIAPHLTLGNAAPLLAAASFKTKREVERLIAALHPMPDVPSVVRKESVRKETPAVPQGVAVALLTAPDMLEATIPASSTEMPGRGSNVPASPAPFALIGKPPSAKPSIVAPLSPARYRIQFTADQGTHDKLRYAQALLRHQILDGDIGTILKKALTLLVADLERRKLGMTTKPRAAAPALAPGSRRVPAHVRREVWVRDDGRCAFLGPAGRCGERGRLEYHHVRPFAAGGPATPANIELRCRAHNGHDAVMYFGREAVERGRG